MSRSLKKRTVHRSYFGKENHCHERKWQEERCKDLVQGFNDIPGFCGAHHCCP